MDSIAIRKATESDVAALVEFNLALARDTEGRQLDRDTLTAGVRAIFEQPGLAFYVVAESEGKVVGALMITNEWSDWRNGMFWWVQSVYVLAEFRRQGIFRRLYEHVQSMAKEANVCGFRLYVEKENEVAQKTYRELGMHECPYLMFEQSNR